MHEHGELLPTQTVEMTPGAVSSGGGGGAEGSAGAGSADGGDGSNAVASELESFSAAGGSEGDAFGVESTATPTLFFSEVTVEDPDGALDDDDEEEDDDEDEDDEMDDYDAEEEAAQEAAYLAEEEARYLAERGEGEDDDELDEKEAAQARAEAARAARQEAQKGRNKKSFPDNAKIDPYDPTTFGFTYLGAVLGAHGLGGELKVRVLSDFGVERFRKGAKLHLKDPQRRFPKEYKVIGGRSAGSGPSNDAWLVKLSGVRTREEAAKLQGSTLFVWRDDRSQALARYLGGATSLWVEMHTKNDAKYG